MPRPRTRDWSLRKWGESCETIGLVCTELKGEPGESDGIKFDVIVCCASYHHFPSIGDTTRVLASFLKPGARYLSQTSKLLG
ncbi:hypothetical protein C8Q74DRAFT_1306825 [Fomes fomentarius]|nr:hypothetical protein C8Q74DRAFT_1306825 [Fomes fomentarius]